MRAAVAVLAAVSLAGSCPTVERAFRDLIRAREDARGDLMRHRHRCRSSAAPRAILPAGARGRSGCVAGHAAPGSRPRSPTTRRVSCSAPDERHRASSSRAAGQPVAADRAAALLRGLNTLSAAGSARRSATSGASPPARARFLGIVPSELSSEQAPPRVDHRGRLRHARRCSSSRPPIPHPRVVRPRRRQRGRPARDRDRLARHSACTPPPHLTHEASRRSRRRDRRDSLLLLGGRHPTDARSRPAARPWGRTNPRPGTSRGTRAAYGQPAAPVAPV